MSFYRGNWESVLYKGEEVDMFVEPLYKYFCAWQNIEEPTYQAKWEIREEKLYLTELEFEGVEELINEIKDYNLTFFFSGQKEVFASWFSGEIKIPRGKSVRDFECFEFQLAYSGPFGFNFLSERELILTFEEGLLIEEKEIDNSIEFRKWQEAEQFEWEKQEAKWKAEEEARKAKSKQ